MGCGLELGWSWGSERPEASASMSPAEAERLHHRLREIEVSDPQAREGFADTPAEMQKARDALLAAGIICKHRQITPAQVKRFMVRLGNVVMQSKGPGYQESCETSGMSLVNTCKRVVMEFSEGLGDDAAICDVSLRVYMDTGGRKSCEDEGIYLFPGPLFPGPLFPRWPFEPQEKGRSIWDLELPPLRLPYILPYIPWSIDNPRRESLFLFR